MSTTLNKGSHSVYSIQLHLVFVTKYRRKVITPEILARLQEIFTNICQKRKAKLLEFNGESDHCHLLASLAPDTLISQLVASLKSASSRVIRSEFKSHVSKFYWKSVFWHDAYCAVSCGDAPREIVKKYLQNQNLSP